jgi:hypothetical protein
VNGRRVSVEEAHRRFVDEVNRLAEAFILQVREQEPARQERDHPVRCWCGNLTWDPSAKCTVHRNVA